jgi:hypothetical protein
VVGSAEVEVVNQEVFNCGIHGHFTETAASQRKKGRFSAMLMRSLHYGEPETLALGLGGDCYQNKPGVPSQACSDSCVA